MARKASPAGTGSRPGRLGGTATGAGMASRDIRRLLRANEADLADAQAGYEQDPSNPAWITARQGLRKVQLQLEINLAAAEERERAEREARKAEAAGRITVEEARERLVRALLSMPEADREAVLERVTGAPLLEVVGE